MYQQLAKWFTLYSVNHKNKQTLETADFFTFTEEILNGKLHFLCSKNITCKGKSEDNFKAV